MSLTSQFDIYDNEQDSIPRSSSGTGTLDSLNNGQILGTGTAFLSEVNEGDYIYIKAQNTTGAFRKVIAVYSNTELTLESAFATPLSTDAFDITPASRIIKVEIDVIASAADIDGKTAAAGSKATYTKGNNKINSAGQFVSPIDIDSTANNSEVNVSIQY